MLAPTSPSYINQFSFEILPAKKQQPANPALDVALTITFSRMEKRNGEELLVADVEFLPFKAMNEDVEVVIAVQNDICRWRSLMHFEATVNEPDDTIIIDNKGGARPGVAFTLRNPLDHSTPFTARFQDPTSNDVGKASAGPFLVEPKEGIFEKEITFKIAYLGKGTESAALLVIETPEICWNYAVRVARS